MSSYGSWRTLRSSASVIAAVSTRKLTSLEGLAHAAGCAAGASDFAIATSCLKTSSGEVRENITKGCAGSDLLLELCRRALAGNHALVHDGDPVTQLVG